MKLRIVQLTDDKKYWFSIADQEGKEYDMEMKYSLAENGHIIVLHEKEKAR